MGSSHTRTITLLVRNGEWAHARHMAGVAPLPVNGTVVLDRRDAGRVLRVSWHAEIGAFVVSLWRDERCVGTVQLAPGDATELVHALVDGLASAGSDVAGGLRPA